MKYAIYVGASKEAVETAKKAILAILATKAEERTKRSALEVLRSVCQATNTTIQNCNFTTK